MQYSYERWATETIHIPEVVELQTLPQESMQQEPSLLALDDLKTLEEDLSFDLEEGMKTYRQYRQSQPERQEEATISQESGWDELAQLVADHVLAYMVHHPFQKELIQLRGKMDEYYRDNRSMAKYVQQLIEENQQLRISVSACELEVLRYRNVLGNLYLKL